MKDMIFGRSLVPGATQGDVVHTTVPLSFWMGIDPQTGVIIDQHHPLCGTNITGKILVLPGGRGSCSGSCGLVELIVSGHAPAALVFESDDAILVLGALLAREIFGLSIPVCSVGPEWFASLASANRLSISNDCISVDGDSDRKLVLQPVSEMALPLQLSDRDQALLAGQEGQARQIAMRLITAFSQVVGATALIDIAQGHIDCCFYTGPAGLAFAERMAAMGAKVQVPTTTNATSVDRQKWRSQGIDAATGENSDRVAAAYIKMGATPCFTCAPYLLETAPVAGEHIAWGESNAVAYANSVLGARSMKYPDFLDVCVSLTGRGPLTTSHTDEGRLATLRIDVDVPRGFDDAFYPLLGYHIGALAGHHIPAITGLAAFQPNRDDLKAFSAAFATTASAPMFHIVGVTPEATDLDAVLADTGFVRNIVIAPQDLNESWRELNSAREEIVGLVSLGNPHFSITEIAKTAALVKGRKKSASTRLMITCGRDVQALAEKAGDVAELEHFGAEFVNDTCWCMIDEKQLSAIKGSVITNSGKFAHYGPGITNRKFHFASLAACIDAACNGWNKPGLPKWLAGGSA